MRNVSDIIIQKTKTHILWSIVFSEKHGVYDIMWENMVHMDRPRMIVQYGACTLLHAGELRQEYRHSKYLLFIAS